MLTLATCGAIACASLWTADPASGSGRAERLPSARLLSAPTAVGAGMLLALAAAAAGPPPTPSTPPPSTPPPAPTAPSPPPPPPTEGGPQAAAGASPATAPVPAATGSVTAPGIEPWDTRTLPELRAEALRLEKTRPSIAAPIVMLAGGGVVALPGLIMTLMGALPLLPGVRVTSINFDPVVVLIIGLALVAVGGTFVILGATQLAPALKKRREVNAQLDAIDARVEALEHPDPNAPGGVRLIVRDRKTRALLAGADAEVGGRALRTDAAGRAVLGGLRPGPVLVEVRLGDYLPAREAVTVVGSKTTELVLDLVAHRDRVPATITGIVRSTRGGARLRAQLEVPELALKTQAAPDGTFSFQALAGKYSVVITAKGHAPQTKTLEVADGDQAIFNVDLHPK